jgi:putative ABC transport system permease protein
LLFENLGLAIESLKANKMRAALTMLGIIIGIASVTTIMSIGNALTAKVANQMGSLGATNIYVMLTEKDKGASSSERMGSSSMLRDEDLLSPELIDSFAEIYAASIKGISLSQAAGSGTAREGRRYANVAITGVNSEYDAVNSLKLIKGRFINEKDTDGFKNVGVISDKAAKSLFGNDDPLGKEMKVYSSDGVYAYSVVGVYKAENSKSAFGGSMSTASEKDASTAVYIPISTANQYSGSKGYSTFTVLSGSGGDTTRLTDRIKDYFNRNYKNEDWEISTLNMDSELDALMSMLGAISLAVGAIAGISLIVGGVGVMNIMLVSVTERTREIGTRKALGAKKSHIKSQFVIEAMLLSLVGGIIGIVLGVALSYLIAPIMGSPPPRLDIPMLAFCVSFSMAIGVFFGYYPASKAANLDPIEALRYE